MLMEHEMKKDALGILVWVIGIILFASNPDLLLAFLAMYCVLLGGSLWTKYGNFFISLFWLFVGIIPFSFLVIWGRFSFVKEIHFFSNEFTLVGYWISVGLLGLPVLGLIVDLLYNTRKSVLHAKGRSYK